MDMATYKAEFLAHYYKGRLRPMHAYAFGLIHVWARFASLMPVAANFFSRAPIFRTVFKWVIGVAPERNVPAFAEESFKKWFRQRLAGLNEQKPPVVLWPDMFNNYFHPNTAKAAVEVLEHAGFRVLVPEQDMSCGRPLYELRHARHRRTLAQADAPRDAAARSRGHARCRFGAELLRRLQRRAAKPAAK